MNVIIVSKYRILMEKAPALPSPIRQWPARLEKLADRHMQEPARRREWRYYAVLCFNAGILPQGFHDRVRGSEISR
jgi:hypothetical protein